MLAPASNLGSFAVTTGRATRLRAACLHLICSALVALAASLLIFQLWYPAPYSDIAGGTRLFLLLVAVDVVLGPALTAVIASPGKRPSELWRDLAVIIVLQLGAFGYGLHAMAIARPVALVFEVDLMRLVSAVDVESKSLAEAPAGLQALSWTGPRLVAAVKPIDPSEQLRTIELGLAGIHLATQPRYWREFESSAGAAWRAAKPITALLARYPEARSSLERLAGESKTRPDDLRFLPLLAHRADWVAVVSGPKARIVGFLPLDGFF